MEAKYNSVYKRDKQLCFLISHFDVILRVFACNLNAADLMLTMHVNKNHIIFDNNVSKINENVISFPFFFQINIIPKNLRISFRKWVERYK